MTNRGTGVEKDTLNHEEHRNLGVTYSWGTQMLTLISPLVILTLMVATTTDEKTHSQ